MLAKKVKSDEAPSFESVMDTIQRRLDSITETDLIAPTGYFGRGEKVGVLPLQQQKLWTLMTLIGDEARPIIEEHNRLGELVQREFGNGRATASHIVAASQKKEVQEAAKRMDVLKAQSQTLNSMHKIVKNIFWNDVRTLFDGWSQKLEIDSNWEAIKASPDDDLGVSVEDILGSMFGRRH
jgi:hypothetical protein